MSRTNAPPAPRRFEGLPGWELVSKGVADLAAGRITVEALVVASASVRLGAIGIALPDLQDRPVSTDLYDAVVDDVGDLRAHGRYNALRRRLTSFLHAAAGA